jgi:hypothetical protein
MGPMTNGTDPRAEGLSTNDYCALLPRQRYSHEAQGLILRLPRTGLTVVPFKETGSGYWDAVVVEGSKTYPRGGYPISLSKVEIETAIELTVGDPVETNFVSTPEEAETLELGQYILTTEGSFKKSEKDGKTLWTRLFKEPLTTAELTFPAKVGGMATPKETSSV